MKIFKTQETSFVVIAHRGDSHYAPENTMSAFKQAYHKEADMIEFDVLLTKDKVPVVIHDNDLKKFGHPGSKVTDMMFHELQNIDVGSWYSSDFKGEPIPALEQVLEWAVDKMLLNIEIKQESVTDQISDDAVEKVVEQVKRFDMQGKVLISSFDYRVPGRVKKIAPEIFTGLLYDKKIAAELSPVELVKKYQADTFNCTWLELYRLRAEDLQQHHIPILIYTVNNKWMMKKLIRKGVSGIFSDKPGLLKSVAKKTKSSQ